MSCTHPVSSLIGTSAGVKCTACGKEFAPEEYAAMCAEKPKPARSQRKGAKAGE